MVMVLSMSAGDQDAGFPIGVGTAFARRFFNANFIIEFGSQEFLLVGCRVAHLGPGLVRLIGVTFAQKGWKGVRWNRNKTFTGGSAA
jgi:hypothetical protein